MIAPCNAEDPSRQLGAEAVILHAISTTLSFPWFTRPVRSLATPPNTCGALTASFTRCCSAAVTDASFPLSSTADTATSSTLPTCSRPNGCWESFTRSSFAHS